MTRRGRPALKDRERFTGNRKPKPERIEPNDKVIKLREAALGDCKAHHSAAEDPMSLALARGWLTEAQHKAGEAYAADYRATHPQRRTIGLSEAPEPSARDVRTIAQMGDWEISAALDSINAKTAGMGMSEDRQASLRRRYNETSLKLGHFAQNEVFSAFCLRLCPLWIARHIFGHRQTADSDRRWKALKEGLDQLDGMTRKQAA